MSNIPENININIEETANFLKQNGRHILEQLANINKNNPNFSFLFPESPYHSIFLQRVEAKLQGSPGGYPYASPAPLPNETDKKKPSSRWGTPIINESPYNYNPQQGQYNMQQQQHQQHNNYAQNYQQGNPNNYNMPNMSHAGNVNQSYPNYYNNPQQGQYYNNNMGYNQQSSGPVPQQVNFSNTQQPLISFPNYSHGNVPNQMNQGGPQANPMMAYGNNNSPTAALPSYMNQFQGQVRPPNERKSSVEKKDMSMSMEAESPKSKINKQYNNPEEVPVGVMADMLKQQAKRYKERNMTLRPYTPLDPEQTPQVIPSVSKVSESVKTKLELFYKFLNDEREIESIISKKKGIGGFDIEMLKKAGGDKRKESIDNKKPAVPDYQNIINSEMGVTADGQTIGNIPGGGEGRKGLGSSYEDVYSSFRKQRSHQYHVSAEERASNRDIPDLCYVCRMPGHLARDCKFGLT